MSIPSEIKKPSKSLIGILVIPSLLPILLSNLWVLDRIFESDIKWHFALGMYILITLIPTAFAMWYGWALKTEFDKYEQD